MEKNSNLLHKIYISPYREQNNCTVKFSLSPSSPTLNLSESCSHVQRISIHTLEKKKLEKY